MYTVTFALGFAAFAYAYDCDNGTFGKECEKKCGHCVDSEDCFHVNGTCLNGCAFGYSGTLCKVEARQLQCNDDCSTFDGSYVANVILSILLFISVGVNIYQKGLIPNVLNDRLGKGNMEIQEQEVYENGPQSYDNLAALDEKHPYIGLDSRKQESHYHNMT